MFIKTYITLLQFLSNPGGPYDIFNFRSIYEGWARSEAFAYAKTYTLAGSNEVMCKYLGLVDMWWVGYLDLSYLMFFIGLSGTIFNYKNFLITMLNIELMYLGVLSSIAIASVFSYAVCGQVYALFILILAASESAIGLGLLVVSFKYRRSLNFNKAQRLRG